MKESNTMETAVKMTVIRNGTYETWGQGRLIEDLARAGVCPNLQ